MFRNLRWKWGKSIKGFSCSIRIMLFIGFKKKSANKKQSTASLFMRGDLNARWRQRKASTLMECLRTRCLRNGYYYYDIIPYKLTWKRRKSAARLVANNCNRLEHKFSIIHLLLIQRRHFCCCILLTSLRHFNRAANKHLSDLFGCNFSCQICSCTWNAFRHFRLLKRKLLRKLVAFGAGISCLVALY